MFGEIVFFIALFITPQSAPQVYEEAAAYEVYAAILPTEWPITVSHAKQLVIRRETRAYKICLKPEKEFEGKVGPAISDYVEQNKREWWLQPKVSIELPYQFLQAASVSKLLVHGQWDEYYRLYPESGGLIELSAVGFNQDRTVAVVYMGHMCGQLCGGGTFHVLEKVDGRWQPLKWNGSSCSWAS